MAGRLRIGGALALALGAADAGCRQEPLVQPTGCRLYAVVSPATLVLKVGDRATVTGIGSSCDGGSRTLTWSVRDTAIAAIVQAYDSTYGTYPYGQLSVARVVAQAPGQTLVIGSLPTRPAVASAARIAVAPAGGT